MKIQKIQSLCILSFFLIACATAPYTHRKQLILIDPDSEMSLGLEAQKQILKKAKLCKDKEIVNMVNRVGWRIAKATRRNLPWEFYVIKDDKTANAFCLPGGKVFVYTGILKYTQDETGLATVLAHEIGHAIARHGAERMSMVLVAQVGEAALATVLKAHSETTRQAFLIGYGLGAQLGVLLPYSRVQEYEADHLGLILMAKAGYDPRKAIAFWERMSQENKKKHIPEFLSTHPTDEKRIEAIKQLLPEALKYYNPNGGENVGN
ncbi:Peptidase family M48 [Candidatus Desulfofervidus auxilii]|uniref:Peptidase family M48 n=1 Tax=Desulfofervidus auxilii TaxID=1621989 RepID=A0A7U4QKV9_DESA2|nr:M48 family metallopeptidase [Candidatus Desulfofervidus auxilii]AMM41196.1 Peptidase family M48 [Candidatus Desulfofervidus auxilii]